jgi:hypothetical protein
VASSSLASRAADGAVWSGGGVLTGHGRLGTMQLQERGRAVASSVAAACAEHRADVTSRKAINMQYMLERQHAGLIATRRARRRCCSHVRCQAAAASTTERLQMEGAYFFFELWRGRIFNRTDR